MLIHVYKFLLTFNATSLLFITYAVHNGMTLDYFFPRLEGVWSSLSYLTYCLLPVSGTWLSIRLSSCFGKDVYENGDIVGVTYATNGYLPSYLGYFFVALSIQNVTTLYFLYVLVFAFTYQSQIQYFNPIYLIFGYGFFEVRTQSGGSHLLISKAAPKIPADLVGLTVNRVNDHTFIER